MAIVLANVCQYVREHKV